MVQRKLKAARSGAKISYELPAFYMEQQKEDYLSGSVVQGRTLLPRRWNRPGQRPRR